MTYGVVIRVVSVALASLAAGCADDVLGQHAASLADSDVTAEVTHASCHGAPGAIDVTVTGDTGPYTFAWSHGPTTEDVDQLPTGAYTLTVTDALGEQVTRTWEVRTGITWTNITGVAADGAGTLVKTASTGWHNAGALSSQVMASDGAMTFEVTGATAGRFMVGLSDYDHDLHYNTIDYALYYNDGSVLIYENGVYRGGLGATAVGDVYSIDRVDATVTYRKNGVVRRTTTVADDTRLVVDTSLYSTGAVATAIATSFCSRPLGPVDPWITRATCYQADGAISPDISTAWNAAYPTTYTWSHGPTTIGVRDLLAGDYTLGVVDGVGRRGSWTFTVVNEGELRWSRIDGAIWDAESATVTKTAPTGWGNAGGFSYDAVPAFETIPFDSDGGVEFRVEHLTSEKFMIGLSAVDENDHYATIDYAVYYNAGKIMFYEDGVYRGSSAYALDVGDQVGVARVGDRIIYYVEESTVREVPVDPTVPLHADFSIYYANTSIKNVATRLVGACWPEVEAAVTASSCDHDDGSIELTVSGGTPPYEFAWSSGATTPAITAGPGRHDVTVTDAAGVAQDFAWEVPARLEWANLAGVTWDAGAATLTKTGPLGWNAGAFSSSVLGASADGAVSFTVPTGPAGRWFLGLSDADAGLGYAGIDFAFYYQNDKIYVYESGAYAGIAIAGAAGDVFEIVRAGTMLQYLRNGVPLRSVAAPAADLHVDVSMYDAGAQASDVHASFCPPPAP